MSCLRRILSPLTVALISAVLVLTASPFAAAAEKVTLEKSVPVTGRKADKTSFSGRVISYDDEGFDLRAKPGETEKVRWDELDAKTRFVVRKSVIDPKDAAAEVQLGRELLGVDGGKEWSDKAFSAALRLDSGLKKSIDDIKKDATAQTKSGKTADATPSTGDDGKDGGKGGGKDSGGGMKPSDGDAAGGGGAGPKTIGDLQKAFWGKQTDEQQAAAVVELKAFAADTQKRMGRQLALNETKYFLFYSDLPDQEAKNWSGLLDRMYAKLAELFAVEKNTNIWRGKGLVFVFRASSDYFRFETLMHETQARGTAGMCHQFGDGMVHIAFYRQDKELEFAHVLVHESVHGFVHRYKSPVPVPSWANEGLAETIATNLLSDKWPGHQKDVKYNAGYFLREYGGVGDLFEADHIVGWQYPVSEMLTTFMIEKNKRGYVAFINGIKEGLTWEDALDKRMKYPRAQLVPDFTAAMNVKLPK